MRKIILIVFTFLFITCGRGGAEVKFASDITRLGVGSRPLGMGKMFTGLADDISAMYMNPAGLAFLKNRQAMTMSGKFVNLVDYLTLATAAPFKFGTLGIGYSGVGFGFDSPGLDLTEITTGEYRVIPSSTEVVSYNYHNYVAALTYGNTFLRPDLSLGTTFKLFSENISNVAGGSASGHDLDIGLMFKPNNNLTLGLLGKNVLPASLGGKIKWDTGQEEALPASFTLGASIKLKSPGEINLGTDYEFRPAQSNIPGLFHTGIEWWVTKIFALRAGIDQDVIGSASGSGLQTSNNLSAGLSLFADNFRFDYAYHRYNEISANDTHFFSIVYQAPEYIPLQTDLPELPPSEELPPTEARVEEAAPPAKGIITSKTITNESTLMITGKTGHPNIKSVKINGKAIPLRKDKFESEVSLMPGKNTIWIAGLDSKGNNVSVKQLKALRLVKFSDVPENYWAKDEIERLGTLNIMPGYSDGTFKPRERIKRADLLINLMNIDKIPPATELEPFPYIDVSTDDWIAPYAKAGYDIKLMIGYPDKTMRPWIWLRRVEGAIMAVRFAKFKLSDVLERPYLDVSARHWAVKEISKAREKSILKFALEYLYPRQEISRAELAIMLANIPKIKVRIHELLDFKTGYQTEYPY